MKLRRILIAVIVAATLIVAAGAVVSFLPTRSGHSVAQTVFGGPTPRAPERDPAATPSSPSPHTSTSKPGTTSKPGASRSKPKNSPQPTQDDSLIAGDGGTSYETIPTATATPYRLPKPTDPPTSIAPADLTSAPGSKIASRSVSTAEDTTQVDIDATTASKPADTIAYYQTVFASLGMRGKPVPAVGGSTAIAFTRGTSTVTLTVSAQKKGSHYLIHGVLRTGA